MKQFIISLDLGTTTLKIALFDNEGVLVAVVTKEYSLLTPRVSWVEEDLEVYWDIISKKYWVDILYYIGIDESRLPVIMESAEQVDTIKPDVAKELGLTTNTIICTGALDRAAGAIGAALAICVPLAEPTFDSNMCMPLHYFTLPNMYMMHTFTNRGMTLRWFRDVFCQLEMPTANLTHEDAYDLISKETAGISAGSLAPDVKSTAKDVIYGFTLMHGKEHFARAILESVGYIVKCNIEEIVAEGNSLKVKGLFGLDLFGYRYVGDAVTLNKRAVAEIELPLVAHSLIISLKVLFLNRLIKL